MSAKKKKILLVEDEPLIQDIYLKKLKEAGFDVTCVFDAEEAKKILRKRSFHLIILDIILPKEDGLSFLKKLRKEKNNIPVIIFSNLEGENYFDEAKKYKVKDYIIKANYTPSEIVQKIQQII
ncbi:response regulator [bacterium]|nr:response regulator [bacterium]